MGAKKNFAKQSKLAGDKAVSALQAQANKLGLNINIQELGESVFEQNKAAGQALIEKFQGQAQAKQNELAGQYKTQLANAQTQGKKAANGSFNSLIKQGNAAANKAIKNVNNKEAQNFLNQVSKLLNKQVQDGFKAANQPKPE